MKDEKDKNGVEVSQKPALVGPRKVIARACNTLSLVILVAVVALAASLLISQILGIKPMAVLSGSMEPAYATGSVVFVDTNVSTDLVAVGDAITYSLAGGETVVTHRVISIDQSKGTFTTKGDANDTLDGPVPFENLIGRAAGFYIPYVGFLLTMAGTPQGWALALFALAFILVLLMVPVVLTPSKQVKGLEGFRSEGLESSKEGLSREGRGGDVGSEGSGHLRTKRHGVS